MVVFAETQRYSIVFDAIISFVLLFFIFICWHYYDWGSMKKNPGGKGLLSGTLLGRMNEKLLFIICTSPFVLLDCYFVREKLETRIDGQGIHYRMRPAQWKERTIGWNQIYWTEVKDYIVYSRSSGAYTYSIDDKYGLYIYLHDGSKLIIGTKRPDELMQAVRQYHR